MRYIIRAIKYFFYFVIIVALILLVLSLSGMISNDPEMIFRNGYDSYWQIAVMFAVVAAFYPMFGFYRKTVLIPGEFSEIKATIVKAMEERGYVLENTDGENMTFRSKSLWGKIRGMFEDRITFTRRMTGYEIEGLRRDIVRLSYYLEERVGGDDE